jgi:uncharacterized cupin superfamily protein/glutathione S-transferase
MPPLRLTGRSSSHFTRVARMLADELGVPIELDVVTDLTSVDPAAYAGNPALKIPALHVDGDVLFGTENICWKLAEVAGRAADPRVVLPHAVTTVRARSAQELVWHAMAAQVQLVVGVQASKLSPDALLFAKGMTGLRSSLAWLDAHLDEVLALLPSPREVSVLEVSLLCLLEHLVFRPTIGLDPFPRLRAFAEAYGARPSAQRTAYRFDAQAKPMAAAPTMLRRPALDPSTVPPRTTSSYPEELRSRVTPREKRALGDPLGLTQFGVNLTTLPPGKESSLRHHHAREDELVFVLEGELVLRTDEGEQLLTAGLCAGFPAGTTDGHHLVNRSDRPARYLEIGSRVEGDSVVYSDVDMACRKNADGAWVYTRRDGSPYGS